MNLQDHALFEEGLTPEFISDLRCQIEALLLPGAKKYFTPSGTAYTQNAPDLKRGGYSGHLKEALSNLCLGCTCW